MLSAYFVNGYLIGHWIAQVGRVATDAILVSLAKNINTNFDIDFDSQQEF